MLSALARSTALLTCVGVCARSAIVVRSHIDASWSTSSKIRMMFNYVALVYALGNSATRLKSHMLHILKQLVLVLGL